MNDYTCGSCTYHTAEKSNTPLFDSAPSVLALGPHGNIGAPMYVRLLSVRVIESSPSLCEMDRLDNKKFRE
jgi:hypothetical protein